MQFDYDKWSMPPRATRKTLQDGKTESPAGFDRGWSCLKVPTCYCFCFTRPYYLLSVPLFLSHPCTHPCSALPSFFTAGLFKRRFSDEGLVLVLAWLLCRDTAGIHKVRIMLVHCFELPLLSFSARASPLSLVFKPLPLKFGLTMYPSFFTTGVVVCGTVVEGCIFCVFAPRVFGCKCVDCAIVCLV